MTVLADAFGHILVVGSDQSITEIPRVFLKLSVVYLETDGLQVFDGEYSGGAGIALSERVSLSDVGDKS